MRNMILIAIGMTLVSAAAEAGETRSLSLSTGETVATSRPANQQRTAEANPPALAQPVAQAPAAPPPATQAAPAPIAPRIMTAEPSTRWQSQPAPRRQAARASKPLDRGWTRSRIVSELHRHGIYW